jgi:FSR family fosmidomycin resistance protein-like MFS transporter
MATEASRASDVLRNRPLLTLMLGHFTVDMYVGVLPVLYPVLTGRFNLDLKTVGLVALAYSGMASLAQPLFGWVADRYGTRYIGLALSWTALCFALIGFAPSFPVLLALAAAAGIGSGAYHPLGSLNAAAVIPERSRNAAMGAYVSGGTFGVACGPLIGAILFHFFGIHGTALMVLPGITIAVWMLFEMRSIALRRTPARGKGQPSADLPPIPIVPMLAVIGVMMSRSWTMSSLQAFIPTWYKGLGYGPEFYSPLATVIVLASAFGNIGTGGFADRFGRRAVTIGSLVLTIPITLLFVQFIGPPAFLIGALLGFTAASTGPLMLVMAQQLMAGRAGLASGLILGLGFVTGALGVPITGAIADAHGIATALRLQVVIVFLTLIIAYFLPSEETMRALPRRGHGGAPAPVPTLKERAGEASD